MFDYTENNFCLANWRVQIYHLQCLVLCSIHSGLSRSGRQCLMSKLIDVAWPSICFVSVLVSVPLVDMTAVSWVLAPRDWLSISSHSPLLQSPTNAYSHTYTAIDGYYIVGNDKYSTKYIVVLSRVVWKINSKKLNIPWVRCVRIFYTLWYVGGGWVGKEAPCM